LCPTLYAKLATDAILPPMRLSVDICVITRKMPLNNLYAFGEEAAVRTAGACTDKKMRVWLTAILSSFKCVRVG
jgi:hypothetical protein